MDARKNFVRADVSTGYDASAVSIVLATGKGSIFPDPATVGAYNIVWKRKDMAVDEDSNIEIVRVTALSGDTLTIIRGQEGTLPSTKNEAGKEYEVFMAATAKMFDDINSALNSKPTILIAYKTANQNIVYNTTPQDDTHLQLTVAENSVYLFELFVFGNANTNSIKMGWTYPAGAALYGYMNFTGYITEDISGDHYPIGGGADIPAIGSWESAGVWYYVWRDTYRDTFKHISVKGILTTSNAGLLKLKWSQYTYSGSATVLKQGSYLKLTKVA
jgi:hypothetical protein